MSRGLTRSLCVVACWLLAGCGDGADDQAPAATVKHFMELMQRSAADEEALEEAYSLLDSGAQRALRARADRARSLSGRSFQPWQMLVQGRFRLRFVPAIPGGTRTREQGDRALVTLTGTRPNERAEVPLVREQGRWRIVLSLPELDGSAQAASAAP